MHPIPTLIQPPSPETASMQVMSLKLLLLPDSALVLGMRCESNDFDVHSLIVCGADYAALEGSHGSNWREVGGAMMGGSGGGGCGGDGKGAMEERG
ncbi:hypothetical protein R6Q59_023122 [Mikania micrantha]